MKIRLLNAGLCACALLMALSGCSSDETLTGDNSTAPQSIKLNISDGMFTSVDNNGAKTRATGAPQKGIERMAFFGPHTSEGYIKAQSGDEHCDP